MSVELALAIIGTLLTAFGTGLAAWQIHLVYAPPVADKKNKRLSGNQTPVYFA